MPSATTIGAFLALATATVAHGETADTALLDVAGQGARAVTPDRLAYLDQLLTPEAFDVASVSRAILDTPIPDADKASLLAALATATDPRIAAPGCRSASKSLRAAAHGAVALNRRAGPAGQRD